MQRAVLIFLALALGASAWAAEIKVSSDPPLPVANIVKNPGVALGQAGKPQDWSFATAEPDNFQTGWVDRGRSGKCLWIKAKSGRMSGYWNQTVPVQPGKTYAFRGYYRLASGRMLCYVHASLILPDNLRVGVDQRFNRGSMRGSWLSPVFLPPDALGGPDPNTWYPFEIKVKIPEPMKAVTFSLGMYFTPGEVWFDDLWAGLADIDLQVNVTAGPGEALRRVVVHQVGVKKPVFESKTIPAPGASFTARVPGVSSEGQYEVEATLANGQVVKQTYPGAAAGQEGK